MNYQDSEKMLIRFVAIKNYQDEMGYKSHLPIDLTLQDLMGNCQECNTELNPQDIEYRICELEDYVLVEAKALCSGCSACIKYTQNIPKDVVGEIKDRWMGKI